MEGSAELRIALSRLWASIIAGAEAATKSACALRSASYCLSCSAAASSRSRAAEPRLLIMSSMFFTVSVSAATTVLSAPSSMISPSFCSADGLRLLHLRGAFASATPRCARQAAPVPGSPGSRSAPSNCRLAARRGMSRPLRSTMVSPRWRSTMPAPALITIAMPAITREGGKQVAPDAPFRKAECP